MGDAKTGPVRLSFNPQLRIEFRGATVTSDAGLLLPRELDERLGLSAVIERHLADPRTGRNRQFPLSDLFRQSIYSRPAGYEDTNDAERLAEDPAFRMLASRERRETSVALTSTLHWFETDVLADEQNSQGLSRLNTELSSGGRRGGGVSERDGRGRETQKHGVANRQSSARRASVNASGRAKERLGEIASSDHGGVVMTGDPEFEPLANAGLVAVEWPPRRRA